jgi:hypothetical protein
MREIEKHIKECIVVYIMVAYPAAVARTRGLQQAKRIKKSLEPAWAPLRMLCLRRIYGSTLSLDRTARGVSLHSGSLSQKPRCPPLNPIKAPTASASAAASVSSVFMGVLSACWRFSYCAIIPSR